MSLNDIIRYRALIMLYRVIRAKILKATIVHQSQNHGASELYSVGHQPSVYNDHISMDV